MRPNSERDAHFALMEKKLKMVKERDEYSHKSKKSSHASSSRGNESFGQEILRINEYYQPPPRRTRREIKEKESVKVVRVDLPYFHGEENVEAYLDWEMKVEQLFASHRVSEERKVLLAILSFQGNAMYWWTALERNRCLHKDPPIDYWNDLRGALRRRHIPSYYNRELMDKLQRLQQKSMSVEEYRQKMELYMMRTSIREDETTTIARFLRGLNLEIRDMVELLPYRDLNDLIQLCIKVEQKFLRKTSSRRESTYPNSYPKKEYKKEREDNMSREKPKDTKCFKCFGRGHIAAQCPNRRTIFLRGRDKYTNQSDVASGEDEEEKTNSEGVYPCQGELMMIRRTLNNQPNMIQETQRENIFHTRCKVFENICSLIVDSGSCCNSCSLRMIEKLSLQVVPHPKPYKLQCINEDGELTVDKQVKIEFSVGNYKDKVLCDVVPMEACHILLGRP